MAHSMIDLDHCRVRTVGAMFNEGMRRVGYQTINPNLSPNYASVQFRYRMHAHEHDTTAAATAAALDTATASSLASSSSSISSRTLRVTSAIPNLLHGDRIGHSVLQMVRDGAYAERVEGLTAASEAHIKESHALYSALPDTLKLQQYHSHPLHRKLARSYPGGGFSCNICCNNYFSGPMMSCNECEYDLCIGCAVNPEAGWRAQKLVRLNIDYVDSTVQLSIAPVLDAGENAAFLHDWDDRATLCAGAYTIVSTQARIMPNCARFKPRSKREEELRNG